MDISRKIRDVNGLIKNKHINNAYQQCISVLGIHGAKAKLLEEAASIANYVHVLDVAVKARDTSKARVTLVSLSWLLQ